MSLRELHDIIKPEFDKINVKVNIDGDNVLYKNGDIVTKLIFGTDQIFPVPDEYVSNHFYRIIKNKVEGKDLFEIIQLILEYIPIMFKFCTVCGSRLLLGTNKIATCVDSEKECAYKIESMLTDDTVINSFNRDKETFLLLVKTATSVCDFPNRLNPYPYHFKNNKIYFRNVMADGANSDFFDMNKLKPVAKKISEMDLVLLLDNVHSDIDLHQKIGEDSYAFLKYIVKSNRANILSSPHIDYIENKDKSLTYTIDNSLEFYNLKYHISIEAPFNKNNTLLLFHGSSAYNWYPIMRMGIKNLSNTKLMAHGAALGPGVYLAKDIVTAIGYCRGTSDVIVGACLVKNHETYKKNENVYVVPNDNDILLKHLVYIKNDTKYQSIQTTVNKHFKNLYEDTKILDIIKMSKIVEKRLHKEKSIIEKKGFSVKYDYMDLWKVTIPELNNVNDHVLQIYFPQQYPIEPPIINITSHVYITGSHCVMDNGIIFVDSIVPCEWVPNSKIINILKDICKSLSTVSNNMKIKKSDEIPREEIIKTYYYLTNSLNLFNV